MDNLREEFLQYSKLDETQRPPNSFDPQSIVAFIRQAAMKSMTTEMVLHDLDFQAKIANQGLQPVDEKEMLGKLQGIGMTLKESQRTLECILKFKASQKYIGQGIHIRRNQQTPPLKCSLIINPDGSILVLIKKKTGIHEIHKILGSGSFKSVKSALALKNGEIVAHCVVNITKQAKLELFNNKYYIPAPHEMQRIADAEKHLVWKVMDECRTSSRFSDFKIDDREIVIYKSSYGDLLVSFPQTRAEGDIHNEKLRTQFLQDPEQVKNGLLSLGETCNALQKKNMVHRDIKPQNVLVKAERDAKGDLILKNGQPKLYLHLSDFGLAQNSAIAKQSQAGTFSTMAPNVYAGNFDPNKADVWSLGCTYFEMFTGVHTLYAQAIELTMKGYKVDIVDHLMRNKDYARDALQKNGCSPELIGIILDMLNPDENARLDMDSVVNQLKNMDTSKFLIQTSIVNQAALATVGANLGGGIPAAQGEYPQPKS